jgi:hypothetical protein
MIVYGDPQFTATAAQLITELQERATHSSSLDELRTQLIAAGELEQAVVDAFADPAILVAAQRVTDAAADCFCGMFSPPRRGDCEMIALLLGDLRQQLGARVEDPLIVKIPEGFAFYSLYPGQYILAAERWSEDHSSARERNVALIGLRSIGTTLSAIVAAALNRIGWRTRRITVRPNGHAFERRVELAHDAIGSARLAIVVDEGPGLSGSSMAAVAIAAQELGVDATAISFFPAHKNGPGPTASQSVREIWRATKRYTADISELRWNGHSLEQLLVADAEEFSGGAVAMIEDVSGGSWRRFAYANESEWPAIDVAFERTKFLVTLSTGRRLLWKFEGLRTMPWIADRTDFDLIVERFRLQRSNGDVIVCPPPRNDTSIGSSPGVAARLGFVMKPWIEGRRLTTTDRFKASEAVGDYISRIGRGPIAPDEALHSVDRLETMLHKNADGLISRSLIEELADAARRVSSTYPQKSYGDGRMSPHEFVAPSEHTFFKADSEGHDCDHTMVGAQSVLWDFAGFAVEWAFNGREVELVASTAGMTVPCIGSSAAFQFHRLAYAAFRLGMVTMNLPRADESEQHRLKAAARFYEAAIAREPDRVGQMTFIERMIAKLSSTETMLTEPGATSSRSK